MTTTQNPNPETTWTVGDTATVKVGQVEYTGKVTAIKTNGCLTVTYRAKNGARKVTHQMPQWVR